MNQTQAIAKLRKIFGKSFSYRVDQKAPTAEQREANLAACREAKRIATEAEAACTARRDEVLAADALYQELKAKAIAAKDAGEKASGGLTRKRITVGIDNGLYFSARSHGDNWDEVVEKVCKTDRS